MKRILGSIAIFVATFLLLSINLKDRPVFSHIYQYSAPFTYQLQKKVEHVVKFGFDGSKAFSSKIFHNSIPHHKSNTDFRNSLKPQESVSKKDKNELDELIKR